MRGDQPEPAEPEEGEYWLVGTGATGDWSGEDGKLASRQLGNWLFVAPRDGMAVLDRSTGQRILFSGGWQVAVPPPAPTGGAPVEQPPAARRAL